MITVLPEKDIKITEAVFKEKGVPFTGDAGMVTAKSGEEILGRCLYYLTESQMTVLLLEPKDDLLMADGVLRSALHIAAERFVLDAVYGENTESEIFKKLGFIKDEKERKLDTDKLFGGCNCKK